MFWSLHVTVPPRLHFAPILNFLGLGFVVVMDACTSGARATLSQHSLIYIYHEGHSRGTIHVVTYFRNFLKHLRTFFGTFWNHYDFLVSTKKMLFFVFLEQIIHMVLYLRIF